jgi:hypothetical protein
MNDVHRDRSEWIRGDRLTRDLVLLGVVAVLGLYIAACGSSSAPTTPSPQTPPTLTATMTDAGGDALPDARVSRTADLLSATVEVDGTTLRFRITLAESSIDLSTAYLLVNLDLDQNATTGIQSIQEQVDIGVIGSEAVLTLLDGLQRAQLLRCTGPSCQVLGSYPTSLNGGILQGSIPMSAIADDGRMNVKISTFAAVDNAGGTGPTDVMPDVGQPPVPVR